ncbi:MAG: phage antirepressor KilAC domain-containing protein, partial [Phocaeicola sp.]
MEITKVFNNEKFGAIRVAGTSEQPLFCLADVCKAVELKNPSSVRARLDNEDVQLIDLHALNSTEGGIIGNANANFITESGLYDVIFQSASPSVKPFKLWVTKEVLPSIRKHGGYLTKEKVEEALLNPDLLIQLATNLKNEQEKARLAESKALLLEQKTIEQAPKVAFANAVEAAKSSCLVGELAKILTQNGYTIGQNRLFKWLRDNKYLGTKGENYNIPNQSHIESGLFELKKGIRSGNDGVMHHTTTVKVTGKGQIYFVNKLLAESK